MLATLGVIRGRRLSAIEPFARLLRLTTLLSGTLTILCAVGIFAVEVYSWMQNGAWEPYRLSSAIDLIRPDHDITYATASAPRSAPPPTSGHALIDWLVDVPVTAVLVVVAVLHLAFYLYILSLEEALLTD